MYPNHVSAVYEGKSFTWAETYARCRRFACYLAGKGIGEGDTVAAMLPNVPAMNEAHFAVPMAGAVLNALNIRLDAEIYSYARAKGLFAGIAFEGARLNTDNRAIERFYGVGYVPEAILFDHQVPSRPEAMLRFLKALP